MRLMGTEINEWLPTGCRDIRDLESGSESGSWDSRSIISKFGLLPYKTKHKITWSMTSDHRCLNQIKSDLFNHGPRFFLKGAKESKPKHTKKKWKIGKQHLDSFYPKNHFEV